MGESNEKDRAKERRGKSWEMEEYLDCKKKRKKKSNLIASITYRKGVLLSNAICFMR